MSFLFMSKKLLLWICLCFALGVSAQKAAYKISAAGENLLLQETASSLYLNMFFSEPHLTLHSGKGDASQWKILKADNRTEVKIPEAGVDYLLQTQMQKNIGQLAYVDGDHVKTKTESDEASVFNFEAGAAAGTWYLKNKKSGTYAQVGENHRPIVFSQGGTLTPDPPAQQLDPKKTYRIVWSQNRQLVITEDTNGVMYVAAPDNSLRQFWKFIPVEGQTNVYHVQNVVTRRYVQSCNRTPSSASKISTGITEVAYHVAKNPLAAVAGAWYLSSTDCENHVDPSKSPRALNKDGASLNVITWTAGHGNKGSYWWIEETTDAYEVRPFLSGKKYCYLIQKGNLALENNLEETLSWTPVSEQKAQTWWFDGESNATGYRIMSHLTGIPLNDGARYKINEDPTTGLYFFVGGDGQILSLDGEKQFTFRRARNQTAQRLKLYKLPCGVSNGLFVQSLSIEGEDAAHSSSYPSQGKRAKTDYYVVDTRGVAKITPSRDNTLSITLNKKPYAETRVYLYFDWNQDGIFERSVELKAHQNMTHNIVIPEGALEGESRFRLRITDNELTAPDEDVEGQIFDGTIYVGKFPNRIVSQPRNGEENKHTIYDLRGIPQRRPQTGIYIINHTPIIRTQVQ